MEQEFEIKKKQATCDSRSSLAAELAAAFPVGFSHYFQTASQLPSPLYASTRSKYSRLHSPEEMRKI